MKKYILLAVTIVAFILTSCKNDEITISKTVNFTVNPATVIEPYTNIEFNTGELESFSTNYKLRIRLYIYDEKGTLVESTSENFTNYAVKMKKSSFVKQGSYTAVVISDIYRPNDNFQYWSVSGQDQLATLKIEDTGIIGQERSVLGISKKKFTVTDKSEDVNIDIKPGGALFLVYYKDIFRFNDVSGYQLAVNKLQESIAFDSSGETTVNAKNNNGSFDWRIDSFDLSDIDQSSISNVYSYAFLMPMTNIGFRFEYLDKEGNGYNPIPNDKGITWNMNPGDAYFCMLDLKDDSDDNIYTYYIKETGANTRSSLSIPIIMQNAVKANVSDVILKSPSKQSLYVKDL